MKTAKKDTGKLMRKLARTKRTYLIAAALVIVFGIFGILANNLSNAATSAVSTETEAGTVVGGATKLTNVAGASGGGSVQFSGSTNPPPNGAIPPITREGTKLMRAGKQYKFAGVNADAFGLNDCREEAPHLEATFMTDANIDQFFRELNPHSVTRIWPYRGQANIPLLDKLVTAAEKYGQYLAPTFFDGNKNPSGGPQCGTTQFGNAPVNLAHIRPIVERYAKDIGARKTNVIAFWEISNEINGNAGWYKSMADGIKQMDPKTLVGTGTSPFGTSDGEVADIHRPASIDLISIHEYDNGCNVSHQANKGINAARSLNKPWYSGESGGTSTGDYESGSSGRGDCLKREWQAYLNQAESAGMMYWDFKMTNSFPPGDTMTFIGGSNVLWEAAKSFRHQYQ